MFSRDRWQEIFDTIRKNKLRTFLSGFTVVVGILIFIVLFGMGNGLKNTFYEFFLQDDALNTLFVYSGRTTKPYNGFAAGRLIEFRNDDLTDMKRNFPLFFEYITPRILRSGYARYKGESNNYAIRAVSPAHRLSEQTIMMKGRYLNQNDLQEKYKVAVIGRLVEKDLFKRDGDKNALGKFLEIDGVMFKVVGVFQDESGDDEERTIYIPYTTRQLLEKSNDKIDMFIFGYQKNIGAVGAKALEKKIGKFLRDKYNIDPDDQNGIFIRNRSEDLQRNLNVANVIQVVISFIGIGTLIAGIVGIGTIMVYVVKERTKELGIRKALGATPSSIVGLILQEAIFITLVSGYIGILIGMALLRLIGNSLQDSYFISNPSVGIGTVILATLMLVKFGLLAGLFPALRAAKVKPIVALRDE